GEQAWPLAAATFILIPKESADKQKMETVLNFFDWAYSKGNEQAAKLDYVSLPDKVKNLVRKEWEKTNLR
uniref:hypothetical protein n=1 Tax=Streptomyces kaempferi TaxID=333725 RepID=UPI0036D40180